MKELIERLKKATEGSREFDRDIAAAVGPVGVRVYRVADDSERIIAAPYTTRTWAMLQAMTAIAPTWDDDISRAKLQAALLAAREGK